VSPRADHGEETNVDGCTAAISYGRVMGVTLYVSIYETR
jgi:hypothetical protein